MTRSDDRLALAACLAGAATALLGLRAPLTLTTGVAVGVAGALLAVRGERRAPAPRLLWAALTVAIAGVVASSLIAFYEEWEIGQRLAEGMPLAWVTEQLRPWGRAAAASRSLALFSALSLLLGAVLSRIGAVKPAVEKTSSGK